MAGGAGEGDGVRPATRPDIGDAKGRRAERSGIRDQSRRDRSLGELHEELRLRTRDEGAPIDAECEAIELLDAAEVGDRLAGRPALEHGVVGLGLAIADVSDKGLPAALYMTVARTLIRAYAQNGRSPGAVRGPNGWWR